MPSSSTSFWSSPVSPASAPWWATDLIATLPRHIGATLAHPHGLKVHACPLPIETFLVKQPWHARYHQNPGNRWLRSTISTLLQGS